jgi:hypothetical protein
MVSPVFADKIILMDFDITRDDKVNMNWLSVIEGKPSDSVEGNYSAIVLDRNGNEISKTTFSLSFYLSGAFEELNSKSVLMKIPYREDANVVQIQKDGNTIFNYIIDSVCDYNFKCEGNENYASCPTDCLSGSKDNYCDGEADGRCDPDCAISVDIDCKAATGFATEAVAGISWLILGATLIIIILVVIIFLYFRKRKMKIGKKKPKKI